jgi:hypothetical protein
MKDSDNKQLASEAHFGCYSSEGYIPGFAVRITVIWCVMVCNLIEIY